MSAIEPTGPSQAVGTAVRHSTTAIKACGSRNDCRGALQLLQYMPMHRLTPGVISYNAAIIACEKDRRWDQAVALLWPMDWLGPTPGVISYNTAIITRAKGR